MSGAPSPRVLGLRPPVGYYGAKARLARRIVELLPSHRVYVETHAGSAAVLFAKPPSAVEVINDVDGEVTHFFRTLRTHGAALAQVCQLTPYSRAEYEDCVDRPADLDPVERARRWWVRCGQSFNKAGAGGRAGWASSAAPRSNPAPDFATRAEELLAAAARLRRVVVENRSAAAVIAKYGLPDAVLYVDPPYLDTTRAGRERSSGRDYRVDIADAHRALAAVLHATPATVLLSGYPSPLYDELYPPLAPARRHRPPPVGQALPHRARYSAETTWSNRPPTHLPALAMSVKSDTACRRDRTQPKAPPSLIKIDETRHRSTARKQLPSAAAPVPPRVGGARGGCVEPPVLTQPPRASLGSISRDHQGRPGRGRAGRWTPRTALWRPR